MRKTRRRSPVRLKELGMLLFIALIVWAGWRLYGGESGTPAEDASSKLHYIVVLGVDRRNDDVGRSDTLFLVGYNEENERVSLLSLPRDTRADIPGFGYDKINHAYAYGGHKLTMKTVEKLLGLKADYYLMIDTRAFQNIVDALGGIDIDVEKRMYYEDPWDDNGGLVIDLYPGEQHLDGEKAMEYVRYRDGEGDIGRIRRQQKFIRAALTTLLNPATLPRLPKFLERIRLAVDTDIPTREFVSWTERLRDVSKLEAKMLPGQGVYYADLSFWLPDIAAGRELLAAELGHTMTPAEKETAAATQTAYIKELPPELQRRLPTADRSEEPELQKDTGTVQNATRKLTPPEVSVMVINSSGINGAGAKTADLLRRRGFVITGVETGKTDAKENTTITTAAGSIDLFYGMPFPCLIMEGGDEAQAVVNIGRDMADFAAEE